MLPYQDEASSLQASASYYDSDSRAIQLSNARAAQYEERIFHDDNLRPSPESEADWAAALPPGNGFVIVDDPERYGLPNGVAYFDGHKRYGVTWGPFPFTYPCSITAD